MAAGQRPINNVVDITNYVMLLTGPADARVRRRPRRRREARRPARARRRDDDHARRRRAHGSTPRCASSTTPRARPRSPASWAARAPRCATATTRVLMEAATWNGPNIQRTSTRLALRTEASGRFEKQLQPEQALEGQAVATQLMIELCGARPVGGTIDVGGPGPEPGDAAAARRAHRAAARRRGPARRRGRHPAPRSASASRDGATDGLDVTVPHLAPRRRHPRGRPDRGGRAHLGARPAPVDAALAPRRGRPARARAAAAPPRRGRARRRRASPRRSAGASPRPAVRAAARPAGRRRRRAREPDVRGPVGHAHDAARLAARRAAPQPLARVRGRAAVRGRRRLPAAHGGRRAGDGRRPATPGTRRTTPTLPDRAHAHRGADLRPRRGRRAGATPSRRAPTSSPPRACSRRCCARCACRLERRARRRRSRSCTRRGRPRCCSAAAARGLARRAAPVGGRRVGPRRRGAASSSTSACSAAAAPGVPRYEDLTSFPAIRQDIAVVVADDVPAAGVLEVVRSAGGALLRDARGVRRLPRRAGRGGPRLARAAARVPRARPHADRRGRRPAAGEDRRRAARPGRGRAAWLGSACSARSGYAGAIAARLIDRHPFFELAHVTARSEAGARLDDIHPRTRVPMRARDLGSRPPVRRRRRARLLAAPRRRARGRRAARARRAGRRPVRRLPAHRPRDLRGLVRRARRPRAASAPPSTGCPSCTATRSRAPTSSPTPAATRPPRCSRSPRSPAPG